MAKHFSSIKFESDNEYAKFQFFQNIYVAFYTANSYLFKVKDRQTRKRCEICLENTKTTSMMSP